jgi:hypothetical protein
VNIVKHTIRKWERDGVALLEPQSEIAVNAALSQTQRLYSRDVVALYCLTGGMADGESDAHFWTLWSLTELVAQNARYSRADILFADFLINSHLYVFRYVSPDVSAVYVDYFNGAEPEMVAGSLNEFFERYLYQPAALAMFP